MSSCSPTSLGSLWLALLCGCQTVLSSDTPASPEPAARPPVEEVSLTVSTYFAEQSGRKAQGTVTIEPGKHLCPPDCAVRVPRGKTVSLTATAGPRSIFGGWDLPCLGSNPYAVTLDQDTSLTATFAPELCGSSFCWENPRPQGNSLRMIRGDSKGTVVAVGEYGTIIRLGDRPLSADFLPGPDQASTANPRSIPESLLAVHVFSGDDFWAAGGEHLPDGVIHHFGDQRYQSWRGLAGELWGVFGTSPDDVWATGYPGAILHYQDRRWTAVELNGDPDPVARWNNNLLRITGTGADDLWVGGRRQISLRRYFRDDLGKPPRWNPPDKTVQALTLNPATGASSSVVDLWVRGTDAFAIGTEAIILHYHEGLWSRYDHRAHAWSTSPSEAIANLTLLGIYGSGPDDVWAVGNNHAATQGVILHYDGTRWTDSLRTGGPPMQSVYTMGPNSPVWMVASIGGIYCLHAGVLRALSDGPAQDIRGLLAMSAEEAVAVGRDGLILHRADGVWQTDGDSWQSAPPAPDLNAIAQASGTGEMFIVGNNATILRGRPGEWRPAQLVEYVIRREQHLYDVVATDKGTAYAVGSQGLLIRYTPGQQPGPAEKLPCPPSGARAVDLYGVAIAPSGELVTVGQMGTVWRFAEGVCEDWSLPSKGPRPDLYAVQRGPDDAWWIAGDDGTLLSRRAGSWRAVPDPRGVLVRVNLKRLLNRSDGLWGVGGVPRPNLMMLMTPPGPPEGVVLHIHDDQIDILPSGTHNELRAITGQRMPLWIGGNAGAILRLRS